MAGTRAFENQEHGGSRNGARERTRSPVRDGCIPVPRYMSTFEKPGYGGHIPLHIDDVPNTEALMQLHCDIPGYAGHVPGVMNRMGRTYGATTRMRAVRTPEIIPGPSPNRVVFSSHGGFRAT